MSRYRRADMVACTMMVTLVMGIVITCWLGYYDLEWKLGLLVTMTIPLIIFCLACLYEVFTKEDKEDE